VVCNEEDRDGRAMVTVVEERVLHCESKKLGHFFTAYNFRNLNRSLPNLAQITFSSC